jgi:type III secretion system low calcium response chaperone LcrH/SycD
MSSIEEREIRKGIEEAAKKLSPSIREEVRQMVSKVFDKGESMRDVLGISEQMTEGIYGQAYRLYNAGKYKEASQLFRLLITLNGTEAKYPMGLAACFHMLKEYLIAAEMYTASGLLDPHTPVPYYHASDCYLALGDKLSAVVALEMAVKRSADREVFSQLKDRAIMTIATLKEEFASAKTV